MSSCLNPVALKEGALRELESKTPHESLVAAKNDGHAKRKPIRCGLTIHPGTGCPLQCTYCYIYDMGFGTHPTPYPLRGEQLVAALLYNKYFYPTKWGTYLAFGSVTEPLLPPIVSRTLEYLKAISKHLGNPCQIATKMPVNDETLDELASLKGLKLSVLVTVTSLHQYRFLEPKAPDPYLRLDAINRLQKRGFIPFLFLRPVLPGLSEEEVDDIVNEAKAAGAYGIVASALRLSPRILKGLMKRGVKAEILERHVKAVAREGFTYVEEGDVLALIRRRALEKGLVFLKRACCASTVAQYLSGTEEAACPNLCFLSRRACDASCPSRCRFKAKGEPRHLDAEQTIMALLQSSRFRIEIREGTVHVKVKAGSPREGLKLKAWISSYLLRRRVLISYAG